MADALEQLTEQHIILASAEIEADLRARSGATVAIWRHFRKRAAESLAQLVTLNVYVPSDRQLIVTHQNEVKRYVEFSTAIAAVFHDGKQLARALSEKELKDLIEIIKGMPEDERPLLEMGLQPDDADMPLD